MSFQFTSYNSKKLKLNKRSLINAIEFHPDRNRANREDALLSQAISYAINGNTKLYTLKDTSSTLKGILGIVALSASEVLIDNIKKPIILIDLLFVNNKYRSKKYECLDNSKISTLLLEYAITKAQEVKELVGISYIALYPDGGKDNLRLVDFYKSIGFDFITNKHEWMYIKL